MGNLTDYARRELELAGAFDDSSLYGGMVGKAVLELVEKFAEQGHSGASANLVVSLFERVARFEPISPLTGAPEEWAIPYGSRGIEQNVRCSRVFRENGVAYDVNARVFEEPDGTRFTSRDSRAQIDFPYTPRTEIVRANADGKLVVG